MTGDEPGYDEQPDKARSVRDAKAERTTKGSDADPAPASTKRRVFAVSSDVDLDAITQAFNVVAVEDETVIVELADDERDEEAAVEAIKELGVSWMAPIEADGRGDESVPTGDVTVRFKTAPDDDELDELAAHHDLEVRGRNEFVAQQVVFTPKSGTTKLLKELQQELDDSDGIEAAWLNVKSQFRRE